MHTNTGLRVSDAVALVQDVFLIEEIARMSDAQYRIAKGAAATALRNNPPVQGDESAARRELWAARGHFLV